MQNQCLKTVRTKWPHNKKLGDHFKWSLVVKNEVKMKCSSRNCRNGSRVLLL